MDNITLAKDLYDAFGRKDEARLRELLHPEGHVTHRNPNACGQFSTTTSEARRSSDRPRAGGTRQARYREVARENRRVFAPPLVS